MPSSRQLAAIMFTDIVGYTALMGKDEKKAFELLKKNREIHKPLIRQFNGIWIKELGDGVLASFRTVTDAVLCAAALHESCNKTEGLQLRIGIHLGEVIFEDRDVFGDGVNIASRLQAIAPIQGTLISEAVYKNIYNKKEFVTEFIREENLKNVSEPVKVYEIKLEEGFRPETIQDFRAGKHTRPPNQRKIVFGIGTLIISAALLSWYFLVHERQAAPSVEYNTLEKSIVVLPFLDLSAGKDQEYFSDGLSDEVRNLLSNIPELKVIGRSTSSSYKGKNEDSRIIAKKLGVANILEGTVQKEGDKIRVSAQLIRSADGFLLWSKTYVRNIESIFKLYDDIAGAISNQLRLKLLTAKAKTTASTINTEVYNLILQGDYFAEKRDSVNLYKALEFYRTALKIDSSNARGWAGVAKCYSLQSTWQRVDRKEGYEEARKAATKSIQLDDDLAEGHYVLGVVKMYDFNWAAAKTEFEKAMNLDPGNADVLRIKGFLYQCIGRYDSAITLTQKAIILDPLLAITHFTLAQHYYYADQLEDAIVYCRKTLELNPQFPRAQTFLGWIYLLQGKPEKALDEMKLQTDEAWQIFGLVLANDALGRKKEADKLLSDFIVRFPKDEMYQTAEIYAFRGEKDKAFEYLEKSFSDKEARLTYFKGDPLLKNLENDPRYKTFLKKMNLPLD